MIVRLGLAAMIVIAIVLAIGMIFADDIATALAAICAFGERLDRDNRTHIVIDKQSRAEFLTVRANDARRRVRIVEPTLRSVD